MRNSRSPHWISRLSAAGGFSAAMNALFLAPTLYMLQIYDRVIPSRSGSTLVMLTIAVLLALAAQAALDGLRSKLLVRASLGEPMSAADQSHLQKECR